MLIGEEGVPSIGWELNGEEATRHRGRGVEADIGMPDFGQAAFLSVVGDLDDLRVAGEARNDRMDIELPPSLSERDLFRRGELLVPEGEDVVIEEGGPDGLKFCGFETGEVDAADFGAKAA
jgi:hypothetical protein